MIEKASKDALYGYGSHIFEFVSKFYWLKVALGIVGSWGPM